MATIQTTTYIFLASRKYPIISNKTSPDYLPNGEPEIQKTDNQEIVSLDIITSFNNAWDATLSKYPVSQGSEITDHLSIRNNRYVLEGVVSDTPIADHPEESLGGKDNGTGADRVAAAIELLQTMHKNAVVFSLYSEYQKIDNCVITSVTFNLSSAMAVMFTIEMEQLRFAYAQTVALNVKTATKKSVASNQNGGGSTKTQASLEKYRQDVSTQTTVNEAANGQ